MSPRVRLARKLRSRAKFLQDFFAQAVKAAVGHDEKEIPRLCFVSKVFGNGVRTGKHAGVLTKGTDTFRNSFGIQAILSAELLGAKNAAENDAVAKGERLRQRILKHFAAHGV